jgi:nitroreductase
VELFDVIRSRHSYRGSYSPGGVPREDLKKIVQAGIQAPSGYNGQSTSFVIVDDTKLLEQIGSILGKPNFGPAAIIVVMNPNATSDKEYSFGVEDYAAATENILLAATALGYATVWIDGNLRRERRAERIGEVLGVPTGRTVRVVLPMGRPAEKRSQNQKKPFEERAWFNRFGG